MKMCVCVFYVCVSVSKQLKRMFEVCAKNA